MAWAGSDFVSLRTAKARALLAGRSARRTVRTGGQRDGMFSVVHPPTRPTHSRQVGPLWPLTIKNTVAPMPKPTAALAVALCCLASFSTQAAAQQLDQIAWLAGCWAAENGEPGSIEVWMPPTGGTMLGLGRTVKGGKTVEHEFMQIRHAADGKLIYVALPSRQKERHSS